MRLRTDLVDLLEAVVDRKLEDFTESRLDWDPRPAVCVVMASQGYPGPYAKGKVITGLDDAARLPDVKVFHAGTKLEGPEVVPAGGPPLALPPLPDPPPAPPRQPYQ